MHQLTVHALLSTVESSWSFQSAKMLLTWCPCYHKSRIKNKNLFMIHLSLNYCLVYFFSWNVVPAFESLDLNLQQYFDTVQFFFQYLIQLQNWTLSFCLIKGNSWKGNNNFKIHYSLRWLIKTTTSILWKITHSLTWSYVACLANDCTKVETLVFCGV